MRILSPDGNTTTSVQSFRTSRHHLIAGIAVLILGWSATALADCVDTRQPTASERDFHSRAMAAIVAALPPVPVGGKLQNKDSLPTLGQLCVGTTGDFTLEAHRYYELNYRKSIVSIAINATRLPATESALSAAYGAASPKRGAGLKVNNVVWKVDGSDSPLRQALADAIDRTRLQSMVGKPLPTVAESQALAAQATPATVGGSAAAAPAAMSSESTASSSAAQSDASSSAPAASSAADPVKDAVDTVNKLRGLFGR